MTDYGVRIEAPHFVARIEVRGARVVEAAPIVKWMRGWDAMMAATYCRRRGWTTAVLR